MAVIAKKKRQPMMINDGSHITWQAGDEFVKSKNISFSLSEIELDHPEPLNENDQSTEDLDDYSYLDENTIATDWDYGILLIGESVEIIE